MNMNKALQNLYHAVSGATTQKVNISKLLVDIHHAITGKESANKNNWARIIDSMATNWPEGGGNPNREQTIVSTAAAPFGEINPTDLYTALVNGGASATMLVQSQSILGKDFTLSLRPGDNLVIYGLDAYADQSNYYAMFAVWGGNLGTVNSLAIDTKATGYVNGTEYASMLTTTLTVIWHPLPE